jgi:hypothetical protein
VVTHGGLVEYVSDKKSLEVVAFQDLADITLKAHASTMSDSMHASLSVWLDLRYRNGRKVSWRSSSFKDDLQVIQSAIESYGAFKASRR